MFAGGGRREILLDLSDRLNDGGRNVIAISIDNPRGWGGVDGPLALPPSVARLPFEPGQPDFAWADEEAGAVVVRHQYSGNVDSIAQSGLPFFRRLGC